MHLDELRPLELRPGWSSCCCQTQTLERKNGEEEKGKGRRLRRRGERIVEESVDALGTPISLSCSTKEFRCYLSTGGNLCPP